MASLYLTVSPQYPCLPIKTLVRNKSLALSLPVPVPTPLSYAPYSLTSGRAVQLPHAHAARGVSAPLGTSLSPLARRTSPSGPATPAAPPPLPCSLPSRPGLSSDTCHGALISLLHLAGPLASCHHPSSVCFSHSKVGSLASVSLGLGCFSVLLDIPPQAPVVMPCSPFFCVPRL